MNHADNLLEVKNISISFPGVKALDDVSFSIKEGKFIRYVARTVRVNLQSLRS